MPQWVQQGTGEYSKRIRHELGFSMLEISAVRRSKSMSPTACREKEANEILKRIGSGDYVIALDVQGKTFSTEELALELGRLRSIGQPVNLVIGGPDGLSEQIRLRANANWSLSRLTLPHGLVRILIIEQLYRAVSILQGHPYHRR